MVPKENVLFFTGDITLFDQSVNLTLLGEVLIETASHYTGNMFGLGFACHKCALFVSLNNDLYAAS